MPVLLSPENGFVFDTHTELQNAFIEKIVRDGPETANEWLKTVKNGKERSFPRVLEFKWRHDGSASYTLEISETESFDHPFSAMTESNGFAVCNLKTDTNYYWRVNGCKPRLFKTAANHPRFIRLDGALNVRDLGGRKIKQGLIYRGSELDGHYTLSDRGVKTFVEELKIKTELDLRGFGEYDANNDPFNGKVNRLQMPYRPYKEVFEDGNKKVLCGIMAAFADEENYPIYVHCLGGADRTGMIAIYLRAIAGESDAEIFADYELTGLCTTYPFGVVGTVDINADALRSRNSGCFGAFRKLLDAAYGGKDAPLCEKVKAFLFDCGMTRNLLESIARIIKA